MEETPEPVEQNGSTVAVSITRRVRQGREPEFEAWLQGITTAASRYPGFLGVQVIRPVAGSREYRAVVRFDSERNFRNWDESEERQAWYSISEELTEDQPVRTNISGTGQERALARAILTAGKWCVGVRRCWLGTTRRSKSSGRHSWHSAGCCDHHRRRRMCDAQTRSNRFRGPDFSQECRNHNLTSVPLASSPAGDDPRADW